MRVTNSKVALASFLAVASSAVFAAGSDTTHKIDVSAKVDNTCVVTSGALNFGNYDPIGANASAALQVGGSFSVQCTKNAGAGAPTSPRAVSIGLDYGANAGAGTQRKLSNGTDTLDYYLYQPTSAASYATCTAAAYTAAVAWDDSTNKLSPGSAFWDGTNKTIAVCGQIPAGKNVSVGSYADTVFIDVLF